MVRRTDSTRSLPSIGRRLLRDLFRSALPESVRNLNPLLVQEAPLLKGNQLGRTGHLDLPFGSAVQVKMAGVADDILVRLHDQVRGPGVEAGAIVGATAVVVVVALGAEAQSHQPSQSQNTDYPPQHR